MQAHHVPHGAGEEPEGVGIAQVGLDREGELGDVRQGADPVRGQAALLQALSEQGDMLIGAGDHGAQAPQLDLLERASRAGSRGR